MMGQKVEKTAALCVVSCMAMIYEQLINGYGALLLIVKNIH